MKIITVDIKDAPYNIHVAAGLLQQSAKLLAEFARGGRLLIVTDKNVESAVLPGLQAALSAAAIEAAVYSLPAGETAKSWAELEKLTDWLLSQHIERSDHIIALGGGVVGDITGFAAHIVKRGCNFIQIPTTLLAQVDSSVGGKTAINSRSGKNLIGAFQQPAMVIIDPGILSSLPKRELSAGIAEVVKYGVIDDLPFFAWCEENIGKLHSGDNHALEAAILHSVTAKARIVAADEKELSGTRALLNLGHTFGHALEAETGYSDRLLHGEAVACGMVLALRYSARLGHCEESEAERLAAALNQASLPVTLQQAGCNANGEKLAAHMEHDKKAKSGRVPFLLAKGIGKTFLSNDVDLNDIAEFLEAERRR